MTGTRPPSVDRLARHLAESGYRDLPDPLLIGVAREAVALFPEDASEHAAANAAAARRRLLQPVVNATGVIIHTNLGRAPLAAGHDPHYSNLELDLVTGRRGDRSSHAGSLLAMLAGAEAATVVNNGAAALLLALATLPPGEVIVSRGELIEIGGGFRIPEVLESSGARLKEVGTTNRTRLSDYRQAITATTVAILKVHTSNYRIVGFTESPGLGELAAEAHGHGLPLIFDAGSGLIDARCQWLAAGRPRWLAQEPAVFQSIAAGADLVTFSGDKLLGGPQAGVIAGGAELVERCKRHPLARALRPGHLTLDALQQTALSYLRRDAGETLPLWRMATARLDDLRARADALGHGEVIDCESVVGGGALPGRTIPSAGIALDGDQTARLRDHHPPVIARVESRNTICDLRTVLPEQDAVLAKAVAG